MYDSYPSINKYLDEEFETYLKKEFKFDKQKEMGYGADWYKKVLWGQLRYAYDNGFNFMDSPGYDPVSVTGQVASGANGANFRFDIMNSAIRPKGSTENCFKSALLRIRDIFGSMPDCAIVPINPPMHAFSTIMAFGPVGVNFINPLKKTVNDIFGRSMKIIEGK